MKYFFGHQFKTKAENFSCAVPPISFLIRQRLPHNDILQEPALALGTHLKIALPSSAEKDSCGMT